MRLNLKKKIFSIKSIPYICLFLIIITFVFEAVFSGSDWYSQQFYILRCLKELSFQVILIYFGIKFYKKSPTNFDEPKDKVKQYEIIELGIFIYVMTTLILYILLNEWINPKLSGSEFGPYLSGLLLVIPLTLKMFKIKPEERKRKRNYVVLIIFTLLGLYFAIGTLYYIIRMFLQIV